MLSEYPLTWESNGVIFTVHEQVEDAVGFVVTATRDERPLPVSNPFIFVNAPLNMSEDNTERLKLMIEDAVLTGEMMLSPTITSPADLPI